MVKNLPANAGDMGSIPGSRRYPGEGNSTPLFLPGESHGQRSLTSYSPWGHKRVRNDLVTKITITMTVIRTKAPRAHTVHLALKACLRLSWYLQKLSHNTKIRQ